MNRQFLKKDMQGGGGGDMHVLRWFMKNVPHLASGNENQNTMRYHLI